MKLVALFGWAFQFVRPNDLLEFLRGFPPLPPSGQPWAQGVLSRAFIAQLLKWPFAVKWWFAQATELTHDSFYDALVGVVHHCSGQAYRQVFEAMNAGLMDAQSGLAVMLSQLGAPNSDKDRDVCH